MTVDLSIFEQFAADGWFWSIGTHREFRFQARIWRYEKDRRTEAGRTPTRLGVGSSLPEAIAALEAHVAAKPYQKTDYA